VKSKRTCSDDVERKILAWLVTGHVGMSSKAMAFKLLGIETDCSHPYDLDDFNRCLLFLEAVPEARDYMDELRPMSKIWDALVSHWGQIESSFLEEVGLDWSKGYRASSTYELMDSIQKGAL